jgi:hypothetical protein
MTQLLIWAIIAIVSGSAEAVLFHKNNGASLDFKYRTGFDIHVAFTAIRAVIVLVLAMFVEHWILFILISALVFPFLHDGFYYQVRNWLSKGRVYPVGFFDQSTTTTAIFSLGIFWRIILFVFGAGMIFALI